ncbi:hypothetical protein LTR70_002145 [Exophiala xenobiotica]|uniref:Uncharacterized protein n=1 Tax=Lithohypha guttulata TaxID=1690604 RepID=A0ABR0K4Y6_9EURO|nr:hypothetical protein LTR24_006807 [Lithohypha guttulata]KAK5326145.1 hypothetical protein LTR70_002145 [Exophiala xenobiotica]
MDSSALFSLFRRAKCDEDGCEEMPVSQWQKTGIPVIIGVVLFIIAFVVMFLIVRKRRLQTKKKEEEAGRKIDLDDVEDRAAFRAGRKT